MNETDFRVLGTSTGYGDTGLLCFSQSILVIIAPSGTGLPLPGMPSLRALIITALPRIAFNSSGVWLGAIVCHVSFPVTSANERPFGTFTLDRSCAARVSVATKMDAASTTSAAMCSRFMRVPPVALPLENQAISAEIQPPDGALLGEVVVDTPRKGPGRAMERGDEDVASDHSRAGRIEPDADDGRFV